MEQYYDAMIHSSHSVVLFFLSITAFRMPVSTLRIQSSTSHFLVFVWLLAGCMACKTPPPFTGLNQCHYTSCRRYERGVGHCSCPVRANWRQGAPPAPDARARGITGMLLHGTGTAASLLAGIAAALMIRRLGDLMARYICPGVYFIYKDPSKTRPGRGRPFKN